MSFFTISTRISPGLIDPAVKAARGEMRRKDRDRRVARVRRVRREVERLLQQAVERGVRFFDEPFLDGLRQAIKDHRSELKRQGFPEAAPIGRRTSSEPVSEPIAARCAEEPRRCCEPLPATVRYRRIRRSERSACSAKHRSAVEPIFVAPLVAFWRQATGDCKPTGSRRFHRTRSFDRRFSFLGPPRNRSP